MQLKKLNKRESKLTNEFDLKINFSNKLASKFPIVHFYLSTKTNVAERAAMVPPEQQRLYGAPKSLFQSCSNVRTFWLCASVLPSSDYTCLFESAALWTQQQQAINVKIKTRTGKTEISWYLCDSATERRPLRIQNIAKVNKQIGLQPL